MRFGQETFLSSAITSEMKRELLRCCATAFGDSSIDVEFVYDDRSTDADVLAKHKSAIILGIMRLFKREKIEFAYPTQTTFTSAPDGTMIMPYPQVQPVAQVEPPAKKG